MRDAVVSLAAGFPVVAGGLVVGVVVAMAWVCARVVAAARAALVGTPAAVVVAAVAAVACTAYTADTSWRFAAHHLDMRSTTERAAMFAAAELALFSCALMARQNLRTTGAPGVPGMLVWVITGVQVIPAFAESGLVGGTVRAFVGPVCAALLWHLAMGIELRHGRPGAASQGLAAVLGREARERLLSRLGVARRGRDAEQITRDRWTVKAVGLAARLERLKGDGREVRRVERRLSKAVGRAGVGASIEQRAKLLELLAARRHAAALATVNLASPWEMPEVHPAGCTPLAIAGADLRRMDPLDAVHLVAAAHPGMRPAELSSLLIEHGVVVSETQVAIALRSAHPRALARASAAGQRRFAVHARYEPDQARGAHSDAHSDAHPEGEPDELDDGPELDPDPLLEEARALDELHQAEHGRPLGLRGLQSGLRIGQRRAQHLQQLLAAEREVQP